MAEPNNPYDVLDELRNIVADLKRVIYGDSTLRTPGMFNELDSLRSDIQSIRRDIETMKSQRPGAAQRGLGYVSFCVAILFAVVAMLGNEELIHARISADAASWLAIMFATIAAVFFLTGFGWLRGG